MLIGNDRINLVKISRGLNISGQVSRLLPREIVLILYNTFIYPYLFYCCVAWGHAAKNVLNLLIIVLQKSAIYVTVSYLSERRPTF